MNNSCFSRWKAIFNAGGAFLAAAIPVSAALVITPTNTNSASQPFNPNWPVATNSLIAGLVPSSVVGDFSAEAVGRNVNSLTAGGSLAIAMITGTSGNTGSTNYVTCGPGSGQSIIYTLPSGATNGYNLTSITVYSGWPDNGRDAQRYVVSYATVAVPTSFVPLASVDYNPAVNGSLATANRVILNDSAGASIAANVVALRFDFTSSVENDYTGYGAITVQGTAATNLVVPPVAITVQNQNSSSAFTPTWKIETNSLIAGQWASSVGAGDFTAGVGVTGLQALTDGTFGSAASYSSYAFCGSGAGQAVTYYVNGATVTNLVVYSGWVNQNRDGQFYNVLYSTMSAPSTFLPLTSVYYNPAVTGISVNRVAFASSTGAPLATNVAFITFDFSPQDANTDYGYSGYAEIIVQGTGGSSNASSPAMTTIVPASTADGADTVLVFNEIMYHPATNEAGLEWIEFYNQLAVDVDVSGWRVSGDTDFVFPAGTRVAGRSYVVLARDPAQLQAVTGLNSNVFGPFLSPLNNQGGALELFNNAGRLMDHVSFGTVGDWPVTPDGAGPSLAKVDHDWGSAAAANWRASQQSGGTPGVENFPSPVLPVTVGFNEVAGTTNAAFWVELMNYGSNAVALGNCILHHDGVTNTDFLFPPNANLNPGAFLVLSNSTLGFVAPAAGEKLFLFAPNRAGVYDGFVLKQTTRARSPDGTGVWRVPNLSTPAASNSFTFHPELVINEIMYNHQDFPAANSSLLPVGNPEEWIEIYNRSASPVDLTGWTLSGGISYAFGAGKALAPGGYLVVARDAGTLRVNYPAIDIVGNYSGRLASDDAIILNDPLGNPANQVHYYGSGHWPEAASGGGSSLELRDPQADNSQAEAWAASQESIKSAWQTYTYRMVAQPSATPTPDNQWHDFVLGLLSAGECWVDDISVIQSPTNNPVQLIANGGFENGLAGWRVLGNHRLSVVETDPANPGNHVLHVVASGPQEHMHNHVEATLARSVTNGLLYEISFRARWISGNHLLNTRLYFNRVARTTALPVPQLNGTPGTVNSCYTPNAGPTFAHFQHQPVVPQASQPVTVFVQAQDPQGVSTCSVWWSVNGGTWSSAPMAVTNGVFAGIIPGQTTGGLVQFFVRAVDTLGAVSTYPARGTNSGAFYRVNDGAANVAIAHNFRILMSPANLALQYATTNLMSNENLPCTVIYDELQVYYDLTVRLKSSERGRVDASRIGFHLEFNPDDLFRGVHPVLLLDRSSGGSRLPLEEILLKHMLAHAAVPAVNSDLCRVIAPQSAQTGLAILSPRFEDQFVAAAFTNGSAGILYELELTYYPLTANAAGYKLPAPDDVQGVDFSNLGNDQETYRYNFIIKNHRSVDDYASLMNLAKGWSLNGSALDAQTRLTMDVDEWLAAYAMVSLGGVSDMYTFGNNHNLMAYVRPSDNKVLYFPWDMDFLFSQSATAPLMGDQNLAKIVNLPGNQRRFYAHIVSDINTTFNAAYMTYWVNAYGAIAGQNYADDLSYISQRGSYALSEISNAGGNAPFNVNGAGTNAVSNNLVTLGGTAPVTISSILINGINYPVTWSSISAWTVSVPVNAATNVLNVSGYDLAGNLVTNQTRTVVFSGTLLNPNQAVVFNEIMYRPSVTNAEYVELFNTATNFSFDLSGWRINGLGYTFPAGSLLAPNGFLVLVKDRQTFAATYGSSLPVFDQFDGNLDTSGETLTLFRPDAVHTNLEVVVNRVRYETTSPWPVLTNGASLQLLDAAQDNRRVGNWAAVNTNATLAPQWVRVSATGIPRTTAISRPLYLYLQSAGDIYLDDISVVAGSVAESGVNYVTNNGFENLLASWTIGSDDNNSASVSSTNVAHTGNRSLHLIASTAGTTQNSSLWQDFSGSLAVGATYTLSFWYLPSTNGGPLTVRFSGSGITITTNPTPTALPVLATSTPSALNSVAATLPAFPSVWLNELQAVNVSGPTNNAGARVPWLELYNAGTNVLSLAGLYLANSDANLTQWAFPTNVSIPSNSFLIVWCDGLTNQSTTNALHAGFSLTASSGSVCLSRLVDGNPQVVDYLNYANLLANWTYGDFPDGQPFYRQSMFVPTAGVTNSDAAIPLTIAINEWMADNGHTLTNPAGGKYDDWFELYNYGTNQVDLGGYYLTSALTNKTKFQIPNNQHYLVPPHGFFLVWADNNNSSNSLARPELHVNFKLSKSGEAIGLFAADGTAIDTQTFGAQATDVSQGRFPDGAPDIFNMPAPTPQTNNVIPNTAPVLAAIGDLYVHVGQAVQFTATASDAQSAYQDLTFSLSNAPAGADINPASGVFRWVTTNAVVPGTNLITVRVTDNGTPALSDAKTFSAVVAPLPQFTGVRLASDGLIQISFNTLPGQHYQVQFKDQLSDVVWSSLGGIISGAGTATVITDNTTGLAHRFYRLLALSQP